MKTHIAAAFILIATLAAQLGASEAGKEFNEADAQLNKVYQRLLQTIDDSDQKDLFVSSQRAWLKFRDQSVAFFAQRYPESKGGLFYNTHLVQERTAFLQSLLSTTPDQDPEGMKPSGY